MNMASINAARIHPLGDEPATADDASSRLEGPSAGSPRGGEPAPRAAEAAGSPARGPAGPASPLRSPSGAAGSATAPGPDRPARVAGRAAAGLPTPTPQPGWRRRPIMTAGLRPAGRHPPPTGRGRP